MNWNRVGDTLSIMPLNLDINASTKRSILSTIESQYDIFGTNIPVMNRSRLFLHRLQKSKDIGWDVELSSELRKEWKNISLQVNAAPKFVLDKFVGNKSATYNLVSCADSSKEIYGVVCYMQNIETRDLSFLIAKNRLLVNKQLESKSIPALEMQAIALAAELLIDVYTSLTKEAVHQNNISKMFVFTDSYVALTWLNSFINTLDKMKNISNFVMNRLHAIKNCCETHPIEFSFISGAENPADCVTRCVSGKLLSKTSFFSGPSFFNTARSLQSRDDLLRVIIPNPLGRKLELHCNLGECIDHDFIGTLTNRYSSYRKLVNVFACVLKCKDKWKKKINIPCNIESQNYCFKATNILIMNEQSIYFPEVVKYFNSEERSLKDLPSLVGRLNLYVASDNILRVKSKFGRFKRYALGRFPILLAKESMLTKLIIRQFHEDFLHVGCYALLAELRKFYYIHHYFSTVKKVIKSCITCGRFKNRTMKLNQNSYKEWRIEAPEIPFAYLFMDHLGPFTVKADKNKVKVWLLCFTCIWSRAINVKICRNLSVTEFLRAFQLHCFEFGLPQYCLSDLGSQLVAGGKIILKYLDDPDTKSYFDGLNVGTVKFEQFAKGKSELGSMVEVCVKAIKKLIHSSIKTNILNYEEFEFLICKVIHIVNRRPIAFKEALRDEDIDVPEAITPETLLKF